MEPQGMTIALALDKNHHSGPFGIGQAVDTIEARLVARLPSEAIALKRDAKPDGKLFTSRSAIGNAKRRLAVIGDLGHTEGLQEVDRQHLCSRIFFESQSRCGLHI